VIRCGCAEAMRPCASGVIITTMRLKVVLEPSDEGGYTVFVPALRGCISEGDSREEALLNIREAIELYLDLPDEEISISAEAEVEELVV
jgi:predicted RNase H-like HicB family nuclease